MRFVSDMKPMHRGIRHLASQLGLLLIALWLAGCAGTPTHVAGPAGASSSPSKDGKEVVVSLREEGDLDRATRADFDAAVDALSHNDNEKAVELLRKVTKGAPSLTAPYINLAIAYENLRQWDGAEQALKEALKINPDHPAANNEYGLVYRKTGRFAEAKSTYERVLAKYPDFVPARKNLGIVCDIYLRDLECALANYRLYAAAMPEDKQAKLWIADLETRLGRATAQ